MPVGFCTGFRVFYFTWSVMQELPFSSLRLVWSPQTEQVFLDPFYDRCLELFMIGTVNDNLTPRKQVW